MTRPCLLLAAVLPLLPLEPLQGQDASFTDSVLDRLTSEAIAANPALRALQSGYRAATRRVRPAGVLADPMIEVGVMDLTLPDFAFTESDFTEVDFAVTQEVPWPGTLGTRTRVAEALATQASAEHASERRMITARVSQLYYKLRYLRTAQTILDQQLVLVESSVSIATSRYATGSVAQTEPLQARLARARLDGELAELAARDAAIRAELRALRNIRGPDSLMVEPIDPVAVLRMVSAEPGHLAMASDSGIPPTHPRLAARQAQLSAATETARLEQLGARPDFVITARYGATSIGPDFFSAFVGVRVPLWAGRKQHQLVRAAREDEQTAQASLDEEIANLNAELTTAYAEARTGVVRLELLVHRILPASEAAADAAVRAYRLGQVDYLNVLMVQDAHYRARLDAAEAAASHLTHLAMLRQLVSPENPQ